MSAHISAQLNDLILIIYDNGTCERTQSYLARFDLFPSHYPHSEPLVPSVSICFNEPAHDPKAAISIPSWNNPFWSNCQTIPILRAWSGSEDSDLRNQRNLTQVQLAKAIGVKQAFISKYETGERRLDFLDLVGICDALGLSIVKFADTFEAARKSAK